MKIKKAVLLSFVVLVLNQFPAFAADTVKLTAEYEKCGARAESNTSRLQDCEAAEFERQDRRLNSAYRSLLPLLPKSKAEELRTVQRKWLEYIEAKCGFWFDREDFNGTLDRLVANHCNVVERARRADEIQVLIHHQGG